MPPCAGASTSSGPRRHPVEATAIRHVLPGAARDGGRGGANAVAAGIGAGLTYANSSLLNESGRCTGHRDAVGYGLYLGSAFGLLLGVGSPGGFLCSSLFLPRLPPAWVRLPPAWPA